MKESPQTPANDILSTQTLVVADVWIATERLRLLRSILRRVGVVLGIGMLTSIVGAVYLDHAWQSWVFVAVMVMLWRFDGANAEKWSLVAVC